MRKAKRLPQAKAVSKRKSTKAAAGLPTVTRIKGLPRLVVVEVQRILDNWHQVGHVASPIEIFARNDGEIVFVLTPFEKKTAKDYLQISNNFLNFVRGRLFNNTGLKKIVVDAKENEWYFGTIAVVKPLLPELPDCKIPINTPLTL